MPPRSTPEQPLTNDYELYVPDWDDAYAFDIEFEDGVNIDLIPELEMGTMRPRLWQIEPGEKLSYHYHNEQEELFYVVSGTGQMLVSEDEEFVEIPEGGFIEPGVRTPRSLRNDTDEDVLCLIVGAPPVFEGVLWDSYDEDGRPTTASSWTSRTCSDRSDRRPPGATTRPDVSHVDCRPRRVFPVA